MTLRNPWIPASVNAAQSFHVAIVCRVCPCCQKGMGGMNSSLRGTQRSFPQLPVNQSSHPVLALALRILAHASPHQNGSKTRPPRPKLQRARSLVTQAPQSYKHTTDRKGIASTTSGSLGHEQVRIIPAVNRYWNLSLFPCLFPLTSSLVFAVAHIQR